MGGKSQRSGCRPRARGREGAWLREARIQTLDGVMGTLAVILASY